MFNLNHFENFAVENGLPLGPAISIIPGPNGNSHGNDNLPPSGLPQNLGNTCDLPERGQFPLDAIPCVLQDYATQLGESYQIPVELPALCMIASVSGALGKQWEALNATADRTTRGNLFFVISLPPGSGKSVANRIAGPFHRIEQERMQNWRENELPHLLGQMQAIEIELCKIKHPKKGDVVNRLELTEKIREQEDVKRKVSYSPALITGNATTSGLATELSRVHNETLWVFSAEAGEVINVMLGLFRKDATDMDLWLSGYSGESYKQTRAGNSGANSIQLKDICLSSLLMVQPYVLDGVLKNPAARERGLLTRLLAVSIETEMPYDDGERRRVDQQVERLWQRLIEDILRLRFDLNTPKQLACSAETVDIFRQFYNETTYQWANGKYADHRNQLTRWRENAIRLAVVLQVATDPLSTEITPKIARDAVRLFKWIGIGFLESMSNGREEQLHERRRVLEKILRQNGGSRLASELKKRNSFKLAELRQLASVFSSSIAIEETPPSSAGGRPGQLVKLIESAAPNPPETTAIGDPYRSISNHTTSGKNEY